jgi:multiple sugar transport system substrate-binding protein
MRVSRPRQSVRSSFSRRTLLRAGAAAGVTTALGSRIHAFAAAGGRFPNGTATLYQATPTVDISGTELKILQWSHFVPSYDAWFDQFVQEWATANGVTASVDHVNTADIPAAFAAEISAGQGHDLIQHIASLAHLEQSVLDLKDVWDEAISRHGDAVENCRLNSYNPTTDKFYSFCHGYAPDPANYRKSLWEAIDMPNGPGTFQELLDGGTKIWNEQGVQMGLGMSQEIDSQMAAQTMIWAFGGSIQDENENVTINSPEVIEAVNFMKQLFQSCMTPEVFSWNAASNNQLLVAGQASYILNSISAFRTAQEQQPETANDIFFSTPLVGPAGEDRALAHAHAAMAYMIPTYSPNQDTAKEFLFHLVANYEAACLGGKLYNFPAFPSVFPELTEEGGPLDNDPAGAQPPDKLNVLKTAADWTVNLGWPGPANALAGQSQNEFVLSNMMAKAARDEMSVEDAVAEAEQILNQMAQTWRDQGLMGGGQ